MNILPALSIRVAAVTEIVEDKQPCCFCGRRTKFRLLLPTDIGNLPTVATCPVCIDELSQGGG